MTSMGQFDGACWAFLGVLQFAAGLMLIAIFFAATLWTGNVRLLAGVGVGVVLLLVGLVVMSS